jgi:glc operon protein GlcG
MHIQLRVLLVFLLAITFGAGAVSAAQATPDLKLTRDVKVISSAGARALADACTTWAEKNKQIVAMAVLDWGGSLIEFHAMEGAPANAIETALMKAHSALRWRRATSETNRLVRSGETLAPTFMDDFPQPGALPIVLNGQVIGAMGVSSELGEKCAQGGHRRGVQGAGNDVRTLNH